MSDWRAWARCRDMGPDLFFAEKAEEDVYVAARAVCDACCVRAQCLQWALEHAETEHGMWGGLTPRERRQERRKRGLARRRPVRVHGTRAGYQRHFTNHDLPPCDECAAANRKYRQEHAS